MVRTRMPFKFGEPDWDQHRRVTLRDDETEATPNPAAAINPDTASGRLAAVKLRLEAESTA